MESLRMSGVSQLLVENNDSHKRAGKGAKETHEALPLISLWLPTPPVTLPHHTTPFRQKSDPVPVRLSENEIKLEKKSKKWRRLDTRHAKQHS